MAKVWITGTAGMMGSHLLEMLEADGHQVLGSYFKPTIDLRELAGKNLEEVNVADWCSVYDSLNRFRPDVIFHLAAQSYPTVSWERPIETITTNVVGTINVFEAVKRLGLKPRIVVACSSAEYGFVSEDEVPVKESHELRPLHPYGVSKVSEDLLSYQYHQNFGMDCVRARIFNCTGTRKVDDALSDFVRRAVDLERNSGERRLRVGNLATRRAIVDVRDLNRALIALYSKGKSGEVYNVSGDMAYLMQDVVDTVIGVCSRRDVEIFQDPALMRPTDEKVIWGDTTRLKADTGWAQTIKLDQTVADMVKYWRGKD